MDTFPGHPATTAFAPSFNALRACIGDALALDVDPQRTRELAAKLASSTFNLLTLGQFKRGKTSLVNALIGADLLPVGVVPLTSVITIVTYGAALSITVVFHDGRKIGIDANALADYATEKGNPRNAKGVHEILICHPSPWLEGGVRIIDTPGIGSVYEHNTDIARRFLPEADAVLFVLSAEQPVSEAERDFLKEVRELKNTVEPDLEAFKPQLGRSVAAGLDRYFEDNRELPAADLQKGLEAHLIAEIRTGFDRWRSQEDEKVQTAFAAVCKRLAARIEDLVDELFRYSSELFDLALDTIRGEPWQSPAREFYYKFWSEPVSLRLLASAVVRAMPRAIAERKLLRQAHTLAAESIETQAGRVRYDFQRRLEASAAEFRALMLNRIDDAIAGIERAMRSGVDRARTGTAEFETARRETELRMRALDELKQRVQASLGAAGNAELSS